MSIYKATVTWRRGDNEDFVDNRYSRGHRWEFDGGVAVPASASPQVVPPPWSVETAVDPEEAFVAALSSCHMLWFLGIAAKRGFRVESYVDRAEGLMERNAEGRVAITKVTLNPRVIFWGRPTPDDAAFEAMHDEAHERCFIANSVKTEVICRATRQSA